MHFLVQFSNKNSIAVFDNECTLWASNSKDDTDVLIYAQRRDLFACIEKIRPVSPENRTGKRLAEAIANDKLLDDLFIVDIDVWYDGNISNRIIIESKIKKALATSELSEKVTVKQREQFRTRTKIHMKR